MPQSHAHRNPAVRLEMRMLLLRKDGAPLRQIEAVGLDFMSVRVAMYCYEYMRKFLRSYKSKKRHLIQESGKLESRYVPTPEEPPPAGQQGDPGVF